MKILIWIIVVVVALFGLRMLNVAKAKRRESPPGPGPGATGQPHVEAMVRCSRCGVYLPRADALPSPAGPTCPDPACAQRH